MVHNLGIIDWQHQGTGYDWAIEANATIKQHILNGNHSALINYNALGKPIQLSVPTPEHYLPLLYSLGLKDDKDTVTFFNDKTVMGSISMTSVMIG
jgi:4,5-DOPA dioxygenase extradiol